MLLAETQRAMGDDASARESTARVLRLKPGWTPANIELALADLYRDFGRLLPAEERYRSALQLQPGLADARYNLAGVLHGSGRLDEAIVELENLLERQPEAVDARERLVQLLHDAGRIDQLETVCREALRRLPGSSVFLQGLAIALWSRARYDEGLAAFGDALEHSVSAEAQEDAALNKASALIALGRPDEGWKVFRGRPTRVRVAASPPEVMHDPSQLAELRTPSRILIRPEQGLGDEIFFLRFAPALRERGHRLSVAGEPKLLQLLAQMPELFDSGGEAASFAVCSGDLPLASGCPVAPPLPLPVDPARRARMKSALQAFGPPPYLGVAWRAGLLPDEMQPQRSHVLQKKVPPGALAGALAPLDARVVLLQRRPAADDLKLFAAQLGREALDMGAVNDDLRDALALLSLLDEYVGVSSTNVHLRAGLPGKALRILVSMPADWRWGVTGATSSWFPEATVYRRAFGEDWTAVLRDLREDLLGKYGAAHH